MCTTPRRRPLAPEFGRTDLDGGCCRVQVPPGACSPRDSVEGMERMPATERIGARVSVEAREGFERIAGEHGVNVTALLEALGLAFQKGQPPAAWLRQVLEEARAVEVERRRRRNID